MYRGEWRLGWPTLAALGLVVIAFTALSLIVAASGTARFITSMGYDAAVGYAVGVVFDFSKGFLLIGTLAFLARRSLLFAAAFGFTWACLAIFSCLATHATVTTAISAIERTGNRKMEIRGNSKAELVAVEQQLDALTRSFVPRPAKTVRERAHTSRERARTSSGCGASWLRRRTSSGCRRKQPSCARAWRMHPSWPPPTRFHRIDERLRFRRAEITGQCQGGGTPRRWRRGGGIVPPSPAPGYPPQAPLAGRRTSGREGGGSRNPPQTLPTACFARRREGASHRDRGDIQPSLACPPHAAAPSPRRPPQSLPGELAGRVPGRAGHMPFSCSKFRGGASPSGRGRICSSCGHSCRLQAVVCHPRARTALDEKARRRAEEAPSRVTPGWPVRVPHCWSSRATPGWPVPGPAGLPQLSQSEYPRIFPPRQPRRPIRRRSPSATWERR